MRRLLQSILAFAPLCAGCASAGDTQGEPGKATPKTEAETDKAMPSDPPDATQPAAEQTPPGETKAKHDDSAPADLESFEARVEIDDKPGGKRLQAVWLVTGRTRKVIDYRANPWWTPFEGRKVKVTGESYSPEGQAISADHFRVHALEIVEPTPDDPIWRVEKEETFTGSFTTHAWPKNSKMEGHTSTVFRNDAGETFWLHDATAVTIELDKPITLRARRVEPSNFVARPGGAYLWVISAQEG